MFVRLKSLKTCNLLYFIAKLCTAWSVYPCKWEATLMQKVKKTPSIIFKTPWKSLTILRYWWLIQCCKNEFLLDINSIWLLPSFCLLRFFSYWFMASFPLITVSFPLITVSFLSCFRLVSSWLPIDSLKCFFWYITDVFIYPCTCPTQGRLSRDGAGMVDDQILELWNPFV